MNKEINNIEEIETVTEEDEVMEPKQKFGAKFVGGVKKHGKKIVGILAVAGVGLAGYVLGKKSGCDDCCLEDDDVEFIDMDSEEVDPE